MWKSCTIGTQQGFSYVTLFSSIFMQQIYIYTYLIKMVQLIHHISSSLISNFKGDFKYLFWHNLFSIFQKRFFNFQTFFLFCTNLDACDWLSWAITTKFPCNIGSKYIVAGWFVIQVMLRLQGSDGAYEVNPCYLVPQTWE